jgi:hypothetical protein
MSPALRTQIAWRPGESVAALLVAAVVLSATARAEAEDLYVVPGLTVSTTFGAPRSEWAFGVECSVVQRFADEGQTASAFVGAVAHAQLFTDGTFRVAAGLEGGAAMLGLELGVALRTGHATRATAASLYGAGFASVGYAYVAYDLNVTFGRRPGVSPFEHMLRIGGKVPLHYASQYAPSPATGVPVVTGHAWELPSARRFFR